jgi:mono/diheme cytochrome c family protein
MKKLTIIFGITASMIAVLLTNSCATQREAAAQKTGAQLWGENCIRCHNNPSPAAYNNVDWETIGLHMRIRANLTDEEITKIVEFMKTAN